MTENELELRQTTGTRKPVCQPANTRTGQSGVLETRDEQGKLVRRAERKCQVVKSLFQTDNNGRNGASDEEQVFTF